MDKIKTGLGQNKSKITRSKKYIRKKIERNSTME